MPSPISDLPSPADALRGLRICFLAGTLGQGGAERQLFYNLKCLTECGAKVDLLCLTEGEFWEKPISNLGVPIYYVGGDPSRFCRLWQIIRMVRRLQPQVIQSQHFYTNTYTALAARVAGIRDIGAIRNDGFSEVASNGPLFGRLNLRLPGVLAANSRVATRSLKHMGMRESRLFYLPNVIDTTHFIPTSRSETVPGPFKILGLGRLAPQKRFDRFLRVIAKLRKAIGPDVIGCIIGSGPLKTELEKTAHELALLPGGISFSEAVTDVRYCFAKSDVLLLTSDHEGMPNVVMEAMACGVPVVATTVGGVGDLIKDEESGFLFEPEDQAAAVAALKRLAGEQGLAQKIGQRARAFIEQHHSTSLLPGILSQFYGKILAPR